MSKFSHKKKLDKKGEIRTHNPQVRQKAPSPSFLRGSEAGALPGVLPDIGTLCAGLVPYSPTIVVYFTISNL